MDTHFPLKVLFLEANFVFFADVCFADGFEDEFYDNSTNSRAHIGSFLLSIIGHTHEFIIYAMRQRASADNLTVCYRKKQMDVQPR